ncbi:MAG: murein DD-endopeptidase [Verrucomicrobiota bacterium]|jgi:murein DD-endopeptidase MepM/ murein hydrolase activator NlpD
MRSSDEEGLEAGRMRKNTALRRRGARFAIVLLASLPATGHSQSERLSLALPTENDAIYRGDGPEFYQYIERDYQGVKSTPWEGGQYGFVRDPVETSAGIVYTRFHEGIDIRPLQRDDRGEPVDPVGAIAAGMVVHTNLVPGFSNYGKYVVVEHRWDGCKYYSLYGHLSSIQVHVGQRVQQRDQLGVLGHTGEGLNQTRAHLHLELNLMLSRQFESWHDSLFKTDPNHNGLYNGINLMGIDIARLYLALRERPSLTIPEFLSEEETLYRVLLPASGHFDLLKFYPWMIGQKSGEKPVSWEVSFNRAGVPLKIEPSGKHVGGPELSYMKQTGVESSYLTRDQIAGRGPNAHLTDKGKRFLRLLIYPD